MNHDADDGQKRSKPELFTCCPTIVRVATTQGKQGIWFLLFPDRENTGNFAVTAGKIFLTQGKSLDCDY